jgi:putative transposase
MTNHIHLVVVPEREDSLARALKRVHSEYALGFNRVDGRTGHLWQNRFFSCPLDESHLITALRYIDLNPGRPSRQAMGLALVERARPYLGTRPRPGVDCDWAAYCGHWDYGEWKDLLLAEMPDDESTAVRQATQTGSPLGSREFVGQLERQAGRRLRVFPRGRPKLAPSPPRATGLQGCLFAGSDE